MKVTAALKAIHRFFTEPVDARPLALFRIAFALVNLASAYLLYPNIDAFFGNSSVVTYELVSANNPQSWFSLFYHFGYRGGQAHAIFLLYVLAGVFLLVGFLGRLASITLWIAILSLHLRNPYVIHGGDLLIRMMAFFLMFAPSSACWSIDALLRRWWRGVRQVDNQQDKSLRIPACGFRMLQLQLCIVYFTTAYSKALGEYWMSGEVVYVVTQLTQFQHFPLPDLLLTSWGSKLLTWLTLAIEFLFPFLIWFSDTRRFIWWSALLLHLGMEYALMIPMFQWTMIACLLLFINREDPVSHPNHYQ